MPVLFSTLFSMWRLRVHLIGGKKLSHHWMGRKLPGMYNCTLDGLYWYVKFIFILGCSINSNLL